MKKLLGSTLVLALAVSLSRVSAAADVLKNFTASGQIEVQAVSANNVTDFNTAKYDQIGNVQTRVMVNAGWDLLDDVHSVVTLTKNNRAWGSSSNASETTQDVQSNVYIDQAYFKIDKLAGAVDATLGRQFYGTPGDLVVYYGPLSHIYGLGVTALDAARFDWNGDMLGVTGVVGKTAGSIRTNTDGGNIDLRGLTANLKGHDAGVYIYEQVSHRSPAGVPSASPSSPNDNLWVAGLKGKYELGGAWLKAEFAKNFGEYRPVGLAAGNYTGWAFLANLGYKAEVANVGAITPWINYAEGSGGSKVNNVFTAIAGDYRPGGIYGFFAPNASQSLSSNANTYSSNSLGDRIIAGVGVKVTPAAVNKLTTGVCYWDYHYQTNTGAQTASGTPALAKRNTHIGSELDLKVDWKHSENVSLNWTLGTFQPGGAINNINGGAVRPATLASFDVAVKF